MFHPRPFIVAHPPISAYKAVACAADVMIKCGTKPIELPNYDSSPTSAITTIQLKLHIAVGAGSVTHVIIGSPLKTGRCDYCISGECLQDIGDILGETLPGEMSITASNSKHHNIQQPTNLAVQRNASPSRS
ncbi:hypothetical protein BC829DRAFT_277774 [Chytridium lagenaria]|nr:hypothetical protein BC829DRAFT_277774 [Chytridium lagenaria]